jgi:hypothetical protein
MIDIHVLLIVLSSAMAMVSPLIYAKAILKGEAQPHRTTRIVLLVNTVLATLSLYSQHDTVAIWLAGVSTLQAIFIFLLSLRYGTGGWAKSDLLCLAIATCGMILWKTTSNPSLALYSTIAADFVGMVPTLIKTYHDSKSEIWQFWTIDTFVGLFSLLAVRNWALTAISYPLYIMLVNLAVALLAIRTRKTN